MSFYTYLWLRKDGTPYYVGKGRMLRAYRKGSPSGVGRILIQEWPDEQLAFENEVRLIALYGRKDLGTGTLNNRTNGGEGLTGLIRTKEHAEKIAVQLRGRPLSKKHRQRIGDAMKGEKNPAFGRPRPDTSSFNTKTKKGKSLSDETRAKMSAAKLGTKLPEETKAKMRHPHKTYRRKNVKPFLD